MQASRLTACVAALSGWGCVVDHKADPPAATEPRACNVDISLDGTANSGPTLVGPLTLDAAGTAICLHLDATKNIVGAHFMAASDQALGDSSGLIGVLQDPDHVTLQDGWDVTIDDAPPSTYLNLEWNAPVHELTEAVLWLHASNASLVATFQLSLFEPLED